jgi:hypothetical protein
MSDESKKRLVASIRWTVAALLLLTYPLSLGPALWLGTHFGFGATAGTINTVYAPVFWACSPKPLHEALHSYLGLWIKLAPPDSAVSLPNG